MLDSVFSKPVPGVDTSASSKLKSTLTGALQTAKEQLGLATKTGDDTVLSSAFVDSLTSVREQALQELDTLMLPSVTNLTSSFGALVKTVSHHRG
jgi:O-succinylbenzoate synthase